ncbi:MAG: bile acid:sodium symporter family protein [Planctomycetia bacterium]|nr:bile acid:sodium symporter family protein [Planctomycetia bacterium]
MTLFKKILTKYLLLWLTLVCVVAFFWEDLFGKGVFDPFRVSKGVMQGMIAVTMLAIGSLLPVEEVRQVFRRWPFVLGGTTIQFLSMPLLAWLFATLFHLSEGYFLGLILVGAVPGAMASNMLTMLARGNVSYSVGLTTSATLFSPIVVPLLLLFLVGTRVELNGMEIATTLLLTVVAPVGVGFCMARFFSWWNRLALALGEIIANLVIIWIIASVVAGNRSLFEHVVWWPVLALALVNISGYAAGYFGGYGIGLDSRMRRALTLEVGMQNAGLGTFLATAYFPQFPETAFCCACYTFGCMFSGIVLSQILRYLARNEETTETETARKEEAA